MSRRPRYSITPAGASTDPRLEGNDLRVLCFLGEHTDDLGWCFLSQVKMADALHIGRATVQRSLTRLVETGYVEIKTSTPSGRPHACYAYRVIMDRDDPEIGPSELEVEDQQQDGGCPPAGTPGAHVERAGVPAMDGHGVPTHARAHNDLNTPPPDVADARARDPIRLTPEAHEIATELAVIAGHDPNILPTRWVSDGPAMRVQMGLDAGWQRSMMIETARGMMAAKRDGPPFSIRYFEPGFAEAHARQSTPAPLPNNREATDGQHRTDRRASAARTGRGHSAFALDFARRASAAGERGS